MPPRFFPIAGLAVLFSAGAALAALPAPPTQTVPWAFPWGSQVPGAMAADALIDKPADRPIVARDGHFYAGAKRIRFWGVNLCFAACFPPHEQADALAERLARFGINAVRLHHMDTSRYPAGIWADAESQTLSAEALDRLDYLVAALKKQGIYSDLNLHVGRRSLRTRGLAEKLPEFDKMIDLFDPELITAQKAYARELLTHVNAYTHARYADEPAVGLVEINNEDTLFLWGGQQKLERLPEPYAGMLRGQWNAWLVAKYGGRAALAQAWNTASAPLGENLLADAALATVGRANSPWIVEQHETARMEVAAQAVGGRPGVALKIGAVTGLSWHLQFNQPRVALKKGQFYTVRFTARADKPVSIGVSVGQAHEPWGTLGLSTEAELTGEPQSFRLGFIAPADEANARLTFLVGGKAATVGLADITLCPGGQVGLAEEEDPARGTVASRTARAATPARTRDWYDFLQGTEQAFFTTMHAYLKKDLGVKCPVTGTIGLGPLGTLSQAGMDFVDAHAYWDHPQFPNNDWSRRNWHIGNTPMVDNPAGATLWALGSTRTLGRPFTVTEYNHAAPNDWQAECVPLIAAYAALQDWDGVFLFAYSHGLPYARDHADGFFDLEGNPTKLALLPAGARLFLGGTVEPLGRVTRTTASRAELLPLGEHYYYEIWPWRRDEKKVSWRTALETRLELAWQAEGAPGAAAAGAAPRVLAWTASGAGTGRFTLATGRAAVFTGFAPAGAEAPGKPVADLGELRVEKLETPFATLVLTPADPAATLEKAERLLLTAVARCETAGMAWDAARRTVSDRWGQGPARIEPVRALLALQSRQPVRVYALTPAGERGAEVPVFSEEAGVAMFRLDQPTLWYEIQRRK